MKRILYWIMSSATLVLAACGNNDDNGGQMPVSGEEEWSLFATTDNPGVLTRVSIGEPSGSGDTRPLQWQTGDKLTVFDGSVMAEFGLLDKQSGEFSGASEDLANNTDYYAVLSKLGVYSTASGKITLSMPDEIAISADDKHLSDNMVLFADGSFKFVDNAVSGVNMSSVTSVLHLKLQLAEGDENRQLVSLEMQSPVAGHFVKKATVNASANVTVEESFDKLTLNFNPALELTASSAVDVKLIVLVNPVAAAPAGNYTFALTDSRGNEAVIEKPAFAIAGGTYYNAPVVKPAGEWVGDGDEPDDPDPDINTLDYVSLVTYDNNGDHYPKNWTASTGLKIYDVSGEGIYKGYVFAGYERDQSVAVLVSSDEEVIYTYNAYSNLAEETCSAYKFVQYPYPGDGAQPGVASPYVTWASGKGVWKLCLDMNTMECFIIRTDWNISGTATEGTPTAMDHSADPENDMWSITTNLVAGEFKFVTTAQYNVVTGEMDSITLGKVSKTKVAEDGDDITIAENGNYTITLDVSNAKSRYSITKN